MDLLTVDPARPDITVIRRAAEIVLAGGVIAYPTDTLYGLAVDPRNDAAIERLFEVKERAGDQAIPLIATDLAQVEREVGRLTDLARRLASAFWPGPLTLVIEASARISPAIHRRTGRVAVRVPDHAVARIVAARCGCAITSTSANLAGQPAPARPGEIAATLRERLDAIVDAGPARGGLPSTIVDATGRTPVLVRQGVVPWVRVLECV